MFYETAKANNWLCTNEEAERRLSTGDFKLFVDYGKDEKLVVYTPYIPLQIIPWNLKENTS